LFIAISIIEHPFCDIILGRGLLEKLLALGRNKSYYIICFNLSVYNNNDQYQTSGNGKKKENGIRSDFNLDGVGQSASCYLPHRVYAYVDLIPKWAFLTPARPNSDKTEEQRDSLSISLNCVHISNNTN
jgi:hypothetical protein